VVLDAKERIRTIDGAARHQKTDWHSASTLKFVHLVAAFVFDESRLDSLDERKQQAPWSS
jgi:hypothetical protein